MFTGIIEALGEVIEIDKGGSAWMAKIKAPKNFTSLSQGASVCCSGACLTITQKDDGWFQADISPETLACTNFKNSQIGTKINLERAMSANTPLDGHIVSGHIDGLAELVKITPQGSAISLTLKSPVELSKFIATKGSVALDGVSLTVNNIKGDLFDIMLIPHTIEILGWAELKPGHLFNLEVDLLARYVGRYLERRQL